MKEEAPNKKLPPKMLGGNGNTSSTPTKTTNDEILSSLLRMNNFDSISSIKDESLDIDLSACVTISADSAMMINGNSLSTTDFWRVLDESAQNSQLDITLSSGDDATNPRTDTLLDANASTRDSKSNPTYDFTIDELLTIKKEITPNSFSGTFLRPETPPPGASITFSPLKKLIKPMSMSTCEKTPTKKPARKQATQQRKTKMPNNGNLNAGGENKKSKAIHFIKEEPPEQLLIDALDNAATSPIANSHTENNNFHAVSASRINSSPPKFQIFMYSGGGSTNNNNNPVNKETVSTNTTKSNYDIVTQISIKNINDEEATKETTTTIPAPSKDISLPEEKHYKCTDCNDMLLQGNAERKTHELAGHRVLFKCNLCVRDFEQESGLKKHLKTHRAVETRKDAWKKCPDCGKCLKLGSMWMHRKIHSENKKYSCDICGQKFVQKINLTHHSRVHTAEKPYECPECQKRFQERSHLYRHQKYHAQIRQYRCEKCGKMYKTERCLKVHNLVHLEQRPFACTVCDKSFISNSKLKQHSNIHTGERPFKCNYCPRDFTNFPNWLKHTRRRHKVDHKTGEQLENIPSYCSKKSTKPAQPKKVATTTTTTTTTTAATTASVNNKSNVNKTSTLEANVDKNKTINFTLPHSTSVTLTVTIPTTTHTNTTKVVTPSTKATIAMKAPIKRQKKKPNAENDQEPQTTSSNNDSNILTSDSITMKLGAISNMKTNLTSTLVANGHQNNSANIIKTPKAKRERKQATPKQVQKTMQPPSTSTLPGSSATTNSGQFALPNKVNLVSTSSVSLIKREIVESTRPLSQISDTLEKSSASIMSSFNDLHCLSITSAEDLIMEQALEMEESGLFDARRNSEMSADMGGHDNAVSATESAAAFHFKVKNEIDTDIDVLGIKQEEFCKFHLR